jgi:hypothetical protein
MAIYTPKDGYVTIGNGASVTIARQDMAARLPEMKQPKQCEMELSSEETTLPVLKNAIVNLSLRRRLLITRMFDANNTD